MQVLHHPRVVDVAHAEQETGDRREDIAEQRRRVHPETVGEQQYHPAVGDEHAEQLGYGEPITGYKEVGQDGDPDRKGDGQDDVVPSGSQVEADIKESDLHGEQDAKDGERLPLAGAEAQVRLGEQCPAEDHDPADDKPHRAQAQGRGVVETDLGRDG